MRAGRLRCGRSGRRGWQRTRLLPGQQAGPAAAHAPVALRRHRIFHRLFHLQVTPAGPAAPSLPDVRITNDRTAPMTPSPARYPIRAGGEPGGGWPAWPDRQRRHRHRHLRGGPRSAGPAWAAEPGPRSWPVPDLGAPALQGGLRPGDHVLQTWAPRSGRGPVDGRRRVDQRRPRRRRPTGPVAVRADRGLPVRIRRCGRVHRLGPDRRVAPARSPSSRPSRNPPSPVRAGPRRNQANPRAWTGRLT